MPTVRLTDRGIRAIKPKPGKRVVVFDAVVPGLAVRVTPTGHRSFCYVYRRKPDHKLRWLTLGALKLADAREEAIQHRAQRSKGWDPVAEKKEARTQARAAKTYRELFEKYVEYVRTRANGPKKSWASDSRILLGAEATADLMRGLGITKHAKKVSRRRATPIVEEWGSKPLYTVGQDGIKLPTITRGDVHDLLDRIEARAPIQCNRTLSCLKAVFNFAVDREWLDANPAARIKPRGKEQARERTLSDAELRTLWNALDVESPVVADVVRALVVTGQRSGEVFGMQWDEIEEGDWWRIPGARTKNGEDHAVWLGPTARDIISRRRAKNPAGCSFVFWSNRKGGGRDSQTPHQPITTLKNAVARLIEATDAEPWVPHDLRRTMKTGLSAIGVPPDVRDKVVNHLVKRDVLDKHYDHYDYAAEKRAALERWDRVVQGVLKNERVVFGSWEADVQRVKDVMHTDTGKNVVAFAQARKR